MCIVQASEILYACFFTIYGTKLDNYGIIINYTSSKSLELRKIV